MHMTVQHQQLGMGMKKEKRPRARPRVDDQREVGRSDQRTGGVHSHNMSMETKGAQMHIMAKDETKEEGRRDVVDGPAR